MSLLSDVLMNMVRAPKKFYYDGPKNSVVKPVYNSILNYRAGVHPTKTPILDPMDWQGDPRYYHGPAWNNRLQVTPQYTNHFLPINQQTQPFGVQDNSRSIQPSLIDILQRFR